MYGAKNSLVLVQHQEPEELEGGWRERRDREKSYPRVHLHQEAHGDRAKVATLHIALMLQVATFFCTL